MEDKTFSVTRSITIVAIVIVICSSLVMCMIKEDEQITNREVSEQLTKQVAAACSGVLPNDEKRISLCTMALEHAMRR